MNKYLLALIFCFQIKSSFGQSIQQIDSVAMKMCESLASLKEIKEDVQVTMIFQKHLPDFFDKFNISSQVQADSIRDKVYYRLQRHCNAFQVILSNLEENKSDWKMLKEKPKSEINKKECSLFLKGGNYYYKESDGKIVNVLITENSWKETFEDGTISLLSLHKTANCEFDLEFIESNNELRRNFSVKGEKYEYGLISGKDGLYNFWVIGKDNAIYSSIFYRKSN